VKNNSEEAELVLEHHSLDAAIAWVNTIAGSLAREDVSLPTARGRVLAEASVDGFAVRADDTVNATERAPRALALNSEILTPGMVPQNPELQPITVTEV
jgi:hypothetical protein